MTALSPPVPIPANDALRVDAVRRLGVLDTATEAEFDDLAWLAAHISGSPMALISLLDADRQWFKARCGTDLEGTPRSVSFCSYTVMGTDLLEVPDAIADPRFTHNPLVTAAPGIRSYVGVPLIGREGYAYGTLCMLSTKPRVLDENQKQALIRLARQAVNQLEARRDRLDAQAQRQTLSLLLEAMPDGVVACGTDGLLREFNHAARQWHGTDPRVLPPAQWAQHFDLYAADGSTLLPTDAIPLVRAWRGEHVRNAELVIRATGQPPRSVLCNADPIDGDHGVALGAVCVMHDITQLKDASAALAAERARLQALVDASRDVAIIVFDPRGHIEVFNPGAERLLGYSAAEVMGQCPTQFHLPEELARHRTTLAVPAPSYVALAAAAAGDLLEQEVWTLLRKDGSHRRVRLSFNVIQDAQQGLTGYLAMAIDVTAELQAQAAAQLAAKRFSGAFDTAPQGMAIVSLEGRWSEINSALCNLLGYSRTQLLGMTFQDVTHPDDLDVDLALLGELLDGKRNSYTLSKRYVSRQGAVLWTLLSVSLVRDSDGAPVHFVSQVLDVTEQHVAAERLAESEARLRAISDATPTLVSQFDAAQRCLFANEAHRSWLGVDPASLVGCHITRLLGRRPGRAGVRRARCGRPRRACHLRLRAAGRCERTRCGDHPGAGNQGHAGASARVFPDGAGCHRAQDPAPLDARTRHPRRAHRPAQSSRLVGSIADRGDACTAAAHRGGGDVPGPGWLQADQRRARPSRRRRRAGGLRPLPAAGSGHALSGGTPGRRRIRGAAGRPARPGARMRRRGRAYPQRRGCWHHLRRAMAADPAQHRRGLATRHHRRHRQPDARRRRSDVCRQACALWRWRYTRWA
ncbi:PAS domain S-box-containing protein [Xanthomonas campestris]|nr:PAS domain S-box-containing protein [Xanthomonas campestris]